MRTHFFRDQSPRENDNEVSVSESGPALINFFTGYALDFINAELTVGPTIQLRAA